MERFSAERFARISSQLGGLRTVARLAKDSEANGFEIGLGGSPFFIMFAQIHQDCHAIGLTVTTRHLDRLLGLFESGVPLAQWESALDAVEQTMQFEMQSTLFLYVENREANYYQQPELFGPEVIRHFPAIRFDMEEAGNCYALERHMACVFHLSRVMEIAVQTFAGMLPHAWLLEVSLASEDAGWGRPFANWQRVALRLKETIERMSGESAAWLPAAAALEIVRVSWRDEVSKPGEMYMREDARELMHMVRWFMVQLARIEEERTR
jgi:hypothetical protein